MAEAINPDALPENLSELTDEQLDAAEARARDESSDLLGQDNLDAEGVARLEQLADYLDSIEGTRTERAAQAEELQARREAAASRLNPEDSTEAPEGDEGDGEDTPADEPDPEETPTDAPADAPEQPEAVAAGGAKRRTPMRQPRNPQPRPPAEGMHTIVAAADTKFGSGSAITKDQLVEAFIEKSGGFPSGVASQANVRHQFQVAKIERHYERTADGLHVGNPDFHDVQSLLQHASSEKRLKNGSLVAAGGWCAPSETLYDLSADESLSGIIDLPTVGVGRGGINFTPGPDFSDIFTSAGFAQTEAEAIAGTTKNCVEVDCPDFTEVRLDAVGICVKAPLLTNSAYPELVRRWLDGTEVANEHKVAARLITSMRTLLGTAIAPTLTGTPITWSTLTAVELVIEGQRQAYRLSDQETLEVIIPRWVRVAIRADLANRMGIGAESVTNAQIAQHFADRGAAVQWVLNYLELSSPKTVAGFPSTFEVMVYPAGTFVRGNQDVISLSTVYDTADLQTNVYTAAFVEDGVLVAKMKNGGARITLPVNVSGMLGAAQLDDSWGNAQVESLGT